MISRDRVRVLVGVVLTLAIVVPLGWMWWNSRLPVVVLRDGHGVRRTTAAARHRPHEHGTAWDMAGMEHASSEVSVPTWTPRRSARPDVVVDLDRPAGQGEARLGQDGRGLHAQRHLARARLIEATVGQLVEVHVHNENVTDGIALHWHGVDVPNAEDGVAGITQNADQGRARTTPTAGSRRTPAPSGTTPTRSPTSRCRGGLLGAIVIHPAQPRARRASTSWRWRTSTTATRRSTAARVTRQSWRRPGQRVRVRAINTDNGPQAIWTTRPSGCVATDGYDVNAADRGHRPGRS